MNAADTRQRRLRADLSLILVTLIWGTAFVSQRDASAHLGAFTFNALRFALGALIIAMLIGLRHWRAPDRAEVRGGILLGALLFAAASLQQIGVSETTAGKAGFITGLYIVIVPLLMALVWREKIGRSVWLAALLALLGLFLLSVQSNLELAHGDVWVLVGALGWALHILLIGHLSPRFNSLRLALFQYLTCALFSLLPSLLLERDSWLRIDQAIWPIVYTGVLSIGVGYTLQVVAQRDTPPAHAAIILSMEAVVAALAGGLLLQEQLNVQQIIGCALMLCGMLLAQLPSVKC
jgi:drug/metabolite transporter (DMT)-like permease